MVRNRELQEVAGNSFMAQDRSWIFYCRPDVEVSRLRIISRDEIETARVFVINARRIHEAAGTGRLECFGKLTNREWPQVIRNRNQLVRLKEIDHLLLTAFVSFEEGLLVCGYVLAACRVRISERRIRKH
jgi:hypothetical protein